MINKSTTNKTLRFYWHHVSKYPKYYGGIAIVMPITIFVFNFVPTLIAADVINRLSKGDYQPHNIWASFGTSLVTYFLALIIGGVVLWRFIDVFMYRLEAGVERDIARRIFGHLMDLGTGFHANTFSGSLVSKNNKIMSSYVRFGDTTVFQVLPMIFSIIFTIIILLARAPLYAIILFLFSILFIFVAIYISRKTRVLSAAHANAESVQTGYLADAVTNVIAVKSFAGGKFEQKKYNKITSNTRSRLLDVMRGHRNQLIGLTSVTNLITGAALVMAVIEATVYKTNLATTYLILSYTSSIAQQLFNFGNSSLRNYNRSMGDAHDMVEILDLEPEVKDPENPEKPKITSGELKFVNVDFTHEGAGDALFQNLSLHVRPGEKVGLVGHSGSGKTTFMRLVLRFSDIDGGEILIDDQNIASITQDDLRSKIAYVPQDPIMFHRTLAENINYGDEDASEERVIKAAKAAHADDFINQLPEGYQTLVGERGIKLSGGQRQRIAIARAMLKDAPLIVLDEATSALDSESEVLIQDSLWKLMEGRTAIVIAHRLSTIQKMDRIIVMEDGSVAEEGTHKDLLEAKGTYAKLWAHQSGGFMED